MFDWARWSSLRAMMQQGVPGAEPDGWLEGWMVGLAQHRWQPRRRLSVLDVQLGSGSRSYLDAWRRQGASVTAIVPGELAAHQGVYGVVALLSFERASCLEPIDFARPFARLEPLLAASRLLQPGGVLFWSYLYAFPQGPDCIHETLEPAAVFDVMIRRGWLPVVPWQQPVERLRIYHDPDTLFVGQQQLLPHTAHQQRITRIFCAVMRPGAAPAICSPREGGLEHVGGRTLSKVLAHRLAAKLRRWLMPTGGQHHV